mmetsp:Transcript_8720/g.27018  ORF Transcript_8720/g.27018 Transcript_8720/m.27018 type:complete len:319 (-) Transcript_8720:967-1923(-)
MDPPAPACGGPEVPAPRGPSGGACSCPCASSHMRARTSRPLLLPSFCSLGASAEALAAAASARRVARAVVAPCAAFAAALLPGATPAAAAAVPAFPAGQRPEAAVGAGGGGIGKPPSTHGAKDGTGTAPAAGGLCPFPSAAGAEPEAVEALPASNGPGGAEAVAVTALQFSSRPGGSGNFLLVTFLVRSSRCVAYFSSNRECFGKYGVSSSCSLASKPVLRPLVSRFMAFTTPRPAAAAGPGAPPSAEEVFGMMWSVGTSRRTHCLFFEPSVRTSAALVFSSASSFSDWVSSAPLSAPVPSLLGGFSAGSAFRNALHC